MEDPKTIGARLRHIRQTRGKTIRVVAGLAGISKTQLADLETGRRALDSITQITALAQALEVAPVDLVRLPVPAPAIGPTDAVIDRVRGALLTVSHGNPAGEVLPVEELRARVGTLNTALCWGDREEEVGAALPRLIQDAHTTLNTGKDTGSMLELLAWLHSQVVVSWLRLAGANLDLCMTGVLLAKAAADRHEGPASQGLAAASAARILAASGSIQVARDSLTAVTVPTTTPHLTQLAGFLALRASLALRAEHPADADALLERATELADRTGQANAYGLGFGPALVTIFRIGGLVSAGRYEQALQLGDGFRVDQHPNPSSRAYHWVNYARAATRTPGRTADAIRALRCAEMVSPNTVARGTWPRELLTELTKRPPRDDQWGRELRGMAYRAGLAS